MQSTLWRYFMLCRRVGSKDNITAAMRVPHVQHALCRFVDDCIAYLAGLVSTAEVLPVVRQQRDKMLTRVVIGALQHTLDALGIRDFSKAMQVMYSATAVLNDRISPFGTSECPTDQAVLPFKTLGCSMQCLNSFCQCRR